MPLQLPYKVILASKSPRRYELLKGLGVEFEVRTMDVDESFPAHLKGEEIALYLSRKKSAAFIPELKQGELVITADTIVWLGNMVYNKPDSAADAIEMLTALSGKMHEVYTGVSIATVSKQVTFYDVARVHFNNIDRADIEWYIENHAPYDKAGAYGIQEWIGYVGIERIEGSFYNVMGLPTGKLYAQLKSFADGKQG